MSEQPHSVPPEDVPAPEGAAAPAPDGDTGTSPGEDMARRLVQDVAAYEVDPPPPARVQDDAP